MPRTIETVADLDNYPDERESTHTQTRPNGDVVVQVVFNDGEFACFLNGDKQAERLL
jgi:hypothetical protein